MYAEMLAERMVPDAAKQQKYLETLRVEADRLSHLVENVLQYARLERGRSHHKRQPVSVAELQRRCCQRLAERAAQSKMALDVHCDPGTGDVVISTDPAAVEQILFNLVDNACKYAAAANDQRIEMTWRDTGRLLVIRVSDHGPGISAKAARRLFRPFSKSVHEAADTAPGVGLGLALSRRLAQDLGGRLEFDTSQLTGATFVLQIPRG
jgi:signal transduction histidine kinase